MCHDITFAASVSTDSAFNFKYSKVGGLYGVRLFLIYNIEILAAPPPVTKLITSHDITD